MTPLIPVMAAALAAAPPAPAYVPAGAVALGAPDRWDYVVADPASGRVYVAHGNLLAVVDGRSGRLIGQIDIAPGGTHGTGVVAAAGLGYTDDGKAGTAVAFDLKTLKVVKRIPAKDDADAVAVDKATGHVFVVEGDPASITVIDPKTNAAITTIQAGEKLEYAADGDDGAVYVAGEEKSDLLKIDARANKVVARWPTPNCTSPHGLAYDPAARRLFMGCTNSKLMVVDARTGKVTAELAIGRGSDAVAFDPVRKRVFSSNGRDGTISVFQQASPDSYRDLGAVTTKVSGRTMSVDPATGRLFVAAADTDPPATPGERPKTRTGTLKLLMFDPAPKGRRP